jgi:hypothetical protein
VVRGESARLVLKFMASNDYKQLRPPIKALGKAYLDCVKTSNSATEQVAQKFDAAITKLVKLVKQFSFAPNELAWKAAHDQAVDEFKSLAAQAHLDIENAASQEEAKPSTKSTSKRTLT